MATNFNYAPSKAYAESIGLTWLGDDYPGLVEADKDASAVGMTQQQVDVCMQHHLWQVKWLFTPKNYSMASRLAIAAKFVFGGK